MKYKILVFGLLLINTFTNKVLAVSASPYPTTITQSDSTEITILLVGDEFSHFTQTTDSLLIQRNEKNIFEYVDLNSVGILTLSGIKANNANKRTYEEIEFVKLLREKKIKEKWIENINKKNRSRIKENVSQITSLNLTSPITGTKKVLCILIGYQDRPFSKTQTNFNNLMNQTGYNGIGSLKDFYKENSYNQLNLDVTVVGPYTSDFSMAYYGANDANNNDVNPQALITEAVQKANPDVNYADFDNDGDGKVDGVHIIFAGYDEAAGGSVNAIWSHRWAIPGITLDGKLITDYSCSSELRSNSGSTICGIGTACHEMGHVFGASDYYDTDYYDNGIFQGTGKWDLMALGSWNDGYGDKPANFNPYTKTQTFQWATTHIINSNRQITLYPASYSSNSFYRINTFTPNEYFLIENRQKLGFDAGLPGDGMLVYHVHSLFDGTSQINNVAHPQKFYPVCASATQNPNSTPASYGNINSSGCPFPGSSNKTSLTRYTTPSLISWTGDGFGFDFLSIHKDAYNIIFNATTYYSISGSSELCDQSTYTISLPSGQTVTWSVSPSNIVSIQSNGNSVTLTKLNGGRVTLTALTNQNINITKEIVVGPPVQLCVNSISNLFQEDWDSGYFKMLPQSGGIPYGGSLSIIDWYYFASSYVWTLAVSPPVGKTVFWSSNGGTVNVSTKSASTGITLTCTASNSCGSISKNFRFHTDNFVPFSLILTPNPVSSQVQVTLVDDLSESNSLESSNVENYTINSYSVSVFDSYGLKVYSGTKKEKKFNIPTSTFRNGIYAVFVTDGKNVYQNKLIVKH